MDIFMILYAAALFYLLTPGIIVKFPANGSNKTIALTHGVIFALLWSISHKFVWNVTRQFDLNIFN